ncbi:MAG TPA: hydroxypyruvate isomerase [Azospirillum sp.]|nr:hydroxypyruvate isomerase [Azospirillum sp.]
MPRFAANLTMLFTELPFLDRFAAAKAAGFDAVEFLFPYDHAPGELAGRLAGTGLSLVLHNLPAGDWAGGERGIACHPDRVAEFRDGVGRAIDYAAQLHCPQVNCLAGIAPAGVAAGRLRDTLLENLSYAADRLKAAGLRLLVEPINTRDIPGFHLTGTRQALDLIAETGADNLFLQYDVYHMQVMEGDIAPTLERHLSSIAHIQVADTPGRNEPGTGELNYPFLFGHLDRLGYQGWVGCEYRPRTTTAAGLGWLAPLRAR